MRVVRVGRFSRILITIVKAALCALCYYRPKSRRSAEKQRTATFSDSPFCEEKQTGRETPKLLLINSTNCV